MPLIQENPLFSKYTPLVQENSLFSNYTPINVSTPSDVIVENNPLFGEIELPEGFSLNDSGYYIAPRNTPSTVDRFDSTNYNDLENYSTNDNRFSIMDKVSETHAEPQSFIMESQNIVTNTTTKKPIKLKKNMNLNLSENKRKAFEFFKSKGLENHHIAGILGNLMGESSLDHTAENKYSKAYGLAQWLGSRKRELFARYGTSPTFELLLEFLWDELNSTEKGAFKKLLETKSVEEATDSFMRYFERPSKKEMAESIKRRIRFSREFLA